MGQYQHQIMIGLMLSNAADYRLLANFLETEGFRPVLVQPLQLEDSAQGCSLLITDEHLGYRHSTALHALKRRIQPLYLPVLVTMAGTVRGTSWLQAGFDDVLRLPLAKDDLHARLGAFLRLRELSVDAERKNNQRFQETFNLAPIGIVHLTREGMQFFTKRHFGEMLERTDESLTADLLLKIVHEADADKLATELKSMLETGSAEPRQFDCRLLTSQLDVLWTSFTISLVSDPERGECHFLCAVNDITARKQLEEALRESEFFLKNIIDALPEHICVVDEHGRILTVNKAWMEFGIANGGQEQTWQDFNYIDVCRSSAPFSEDARDFAEGLSQVLNGQCCEFKFEYPCHAPHEQRWFAAKVTRFMIRGATRLVVSHENVTERRRTENHLTFLAHYDSLTGLANRSMFYERLGKTLLQAKRSDWILAVLFIDLDHFKMVNDTLGHSAGDELLRQVTGRISDCLRNTDTIGRLGGDEFGVFLSDLASDQDAAVVAHKIMSALAEHFNILGNEVFVTSSIGISLFPTDSADVEGLIANADTAMYRSKELGRNNFQFFTREMNAKVLKRAALETGLRRALERSELLLHYQPQIDSRSGKIKGLEALLRWRHPELGNVSPEAFIPVAEETGLIIPIGEWTLRTACLQNKAWQQAGYDPVIVAVNLSARQFKLNDLVGSVSRVLDETGLDPCYLELEITEGIVMENADLLIAKLQQLKKLGVRLSIDDFGTGYSNLRYLTRFPLDMLKIDKSFIHLMGNNGKEAVIAASIIGLGHSLQLEVIAEGVETNEQLENLQLLGCDYIQGFLISKPDSAENIVRIMERSKTLV